MTREQWMKGGPEWRAQNPLDATALDRSAARDVNGTGTGKILVDFKNMPKGVSGEAEGDGLFKKTEVSRQTMMEPAKDGPNVGDEEY